MIGPTPLRQKVGHKARFYQSHRVETGDAVMVMLELNGSGGLWVELGGTFISDEPDETLQKVQNDTVKVQHYIASLLKPGATRGEIYDKYNKYVEYMGYAKGTCIHVHGQGCDLMERPRICGKDPMVIRPDMNIIIHPTFAENGAYTLACDNYPTTDAESVRIHETSQGLVKAAHC